MNIGCGINLSYNELPVYDNLYMNMLDNKICIVILDNKNGFNILDGQTLSELNSCISFIEDNVEILSVIITGKGTKSFSAGADIKEMAEMNYEESKKYSRLAMDTFLKIYNGKKVYFSTINGIALGGGIELSLYCDFRIASQKAKMGNPEVKLGITCGFGGTQMLGKIIGLSNARRLLLTGEIINAEEALKIGLVDYVFEDSILIEESIKIATNISNFSCDAVKKMKYLINESSNLSVEEGLNIENELFSELFKEEKTMRKLREYLNKK